MQSQRRNKEIIELERAANEKNRDSANEATRFFLCSTIACRSPILFCFLDSLLVRSFVPDRTCAALTFAPQFVVLKVFVHLFLEVRLFLSKFVAYLVHSGQIIILQGTLIPAYIVNALDKSSCTRRRRISAYSLLMCSVLRHRFEARTFRTTVPEGNCLSSRTSYHTGHTHKVAHMVC